MIGFDSDEEFFCCVRGRTGRLLREHGVGFLSPGLVFYAPFGFENGMVWTGRCPCGQRLALACRSGPDGDGELFWNCFKCFPDYEVVPDEVFEDGGVEGGLG